MFKNRSVDVHAFSMVPNAQIPRSMFDRQFCHKTTFDAGYLVPFLVDEVLPGDTFSVKSTLFARLATPIVPVMDNLHLDTFFFFVPNRLLWKNWVKFMGQQDNPGDSISYVVPTMTSPVGGYVANSLHDYFGLPTVGQVGAGNTVTHNSLALRAYNLIYNQWFRDENLQNSVQDDSASDGPDTYSNYVLLRRGKRKDYFTGALPWTQKGAQVTLPLGTSAPVMTSVGAQVTGAQTPMHFKDSSGGSSNGKLFGNNAGYLWDDTTNIVPNSTGFYPDNLYADLSAATAASINQIRQAFQIQRLLERDARGGTRYTEIVRSHFGVISPDARLQRPEYLGGGSSPIIVSPIAQNSATGLTGGSTPAGTLAAMATVTARNHGFTQSFTEHGVVIGLVNIRADLTYQQGMRKMWSRSTRYDFYFPVFAHLGEQAVLNQEIYCDGSANDSAVFGYQERWAEYRYMPSMITGLFRSTHATPVDMWHLAQKFTALPTLNTTFIQDTPPVSRVVAVGASANGQQFIFDSFTDIRCTRAMPMYSVPGLVDHF